ncbi:hypothetical protein EV363DRAFT_1300052 [Boletus edulis]|nr:hypothetical protein EV363DRAFT_1300052 [Boletus edulis]
MSDIASIKDWPEGCLVECKNDNDDALTVKFAERQRRAKVHKEEEAWHKAEEEHWEVEVRRKAEEERQRKVCTAELCMKREHEQQAEKAKGKGKQRSGDLSSHPRKRSRKMRHQSVAGGRRRSQKSAKGASKEDWHVQSLPWEQREQRVVHARKCISHAREQGTKRSHHAKGRSIRTISEHWRSGQGDDGVGREVGGGTRGLVEEVREIRKKMTKVKQERKEGKDMEMQTEGTEVSDDSEVSEDEASKGLEELTTEEMEAGAEDDGEGNE